MSEIRLEPRNRKEHGLSPDDLLIADPSNVKRSGSGWIKGLFAVAVVAALGTAGAGAWRSKGGQVPEFAKLEDKLEDHFRLDHARELLGKYYDRSVVRSAEKAEPENIESFALETVKRKLDDKWKPAADRIYETIRFEARRYGFDPLFLIAVIDGESSFKPEVRGPVGEIGMMQLRADTAKWIASMYHMPFGGEKSLKDPITNIQLGAAYIAYLRDKHDSHGRLYLSAYNMGSKNVDRALSKNIWPKDYAQHVMKRYIKLYARLKKTIQDRSSASEAPPVEKPTAEETTNEVKHLQTKKPVARSLSSRSSGSRRAEAKAEQPRRRHRSS